MTHSWAPRGKNSFSLFTHIHWTGSMPTGQANGGLFLAAKTSLCQAPTSSPQRVVLITHYLILSEKKEKKGSRVLRLTSPCSPTIPADNAHDGTLKCHIPVSKTKHTKPRVVIVTITITNCFEILSLASCCPYPNSGTHHSSLTTPLPFCHAGASLSVLALVHWSLSLHSQLLSTLLTPPTQHIPPPASFLQSPLAQSREVLSYPAFCRTQSP